MTAVIESQLLDVAPINTTSTYIGDSLFASRLRHSGEEPADSAHGATPEIAVYTDADVAIAKRFLISSGLVETPAFGLCCPPCPAAAPWTTPAR
ncbi:hypothetical protein ABZ519_41490 [Streptomyces collinus]